MSEKIPISLHNSDLFLNPEFTNINGNKINIDNAKKSLLKKGPSLGENNHVKSLRTSSLLPPVHTSLYLSKSVTSYLFTKKSLDKRYKSAENEQSYKKSKVELKKKRYTRLESLFIEKPERSTVEQTRIKPNLAQSDTELDNTITNSFTSLSFPVQEKSLAKVNKSSIFLPDFGISVLQKLRFYKPREFLLVTINLILFSVLAIVQRSHYGKGSFRTSTNKAELSSGSYTTFCTSKMPNTTSSYLETGGALLAAEVPQSLQKGRSKDINPVRQDRALTMPWEDENKKDFVGLFSGESDINCYRTGVLQKQSFYKQPSTGLRNKKEELKQKSSPFFSSSTGTVLPSKNEVFVSKQAQRSCLAKTSFLQGKTKRNLLLRQPWYCMKACNTWNNKVVATRFKGLLPVIQKQSFCNAQQGFNEEVKLKSKAFVTDKVYRNLTSSNNNKIRGFQYCIPFYKSQERISAESDTIPLKRGTIYSKKTKKNNSFGKYQANSSILIPYTTFLLQDKAKISSIAASQSVLKRFFYKYGFLVVSSSKRVSESRTYKEADKEHLTRSLYVDETKPPYVDEIRQHLKLKDGCASSNKLNFHLYKNVEISRACTSLAESEQSLNKALTQRKQSFIRNSTQPSRNLKVIGNHLQNQRFCILSSSNQPSNFKTKLGSRLVQALLPVVSEHKIGRYSFVLGNMEDRSKFSKKENNGKTHKAFFPSGFVWSRFNLGKLGFAKFVQVQDAIPTFGFVPDCLQQNTSVSGYQFAELQEKEIAYLFRKQALFRFHVNISDKKTVFQRLFIQLTTPFRTFKSDYLISQVLSTFSFKKANLFQAPLNRRSQANVRPDLIRHLKDVDLPKLETDSIKMQYTQVNLDEIKSIKDVFEKLGRDYEDYLRQPKDSLPALIISPSLEDDQEIEEEGIQIFRKRDFIKNKRVNPKDKNGRQSIENTEFLSPMASELPENKKRSGRIVSKNEMQNHQLLVKNALRQAQEEIDSIAKKEEKGTEKDKQVIPPLTRLEALYTIRNRERKHEQAKDFISGKGAISDGASNKSKAFVSSPVFEKLFLYWDKPNSYASPFKNEVIQKQSFCKASKQAQQGSGKEVKTKNKAFVTDNESGWILTPWLFSKLGDGNICIDRRHSFFGEMSLPAKKLTAQEQKQIFQQKANPLLKIKTRNTKLLSDSSPDKVSALDPHNFEFNSVAQKLYFCKATIPLSLLSQFSILSKVNHSKNGPPIFQVGAVNAELCFNKTLTKPYKKSKGFIKEPPVKIQLKETLTEKISSKDVISSSDLVRSKNRIYFFDNLSQNKGCQSSTPKIRGTPLGSPVSHRVWQPKRMEPSTFRVSSRNKSTPVLPRISQKNWRDIMEWQVRKHFIEEDKRLLPLSSVSKNKKSLKIKKVNLYLPWISIKKSIDFSLSRTETNDSANALHLPRTGAAITFLTKNKLDLGNKTNPGSTVVGALNETILSVDFKRTNYWRLPTQQKTYTANLPSSYKNEVIQKQSFCKASKQALNKPKSLVTGSFVKGNTQPSSTLQRNTGQSLVQMPKKNLGISEKILNKSILFESVTKYSWLFIYTFVFVLMFKQLFTLVYEVGLKDFFIKFLNSDLGRTITSEEFRYSIQNSPLTESYMPKKRLKGLFGLERNKVQLLEIIWFLRNRCQGRNGPRGILLVGPPGVESVSVVQAIAGEANLPIIVQSLEKIAQDNEPQRQLEQLYMRAHKQAPCVLFLDQLDTIGARRDQLFTDKTRGGNGSLFISSSSQGQDKQMGSSLSSETYLNSHTSRSILNASPEVGLFTSHSESNNTITSNPFQRNQGGSAIEDYNGSMNNGGTKQSFVSPGNKLNVVLRLLTILDGITQSSGVVTVATARDLTKLDPALLRPKRFDRRIYLSLPNQQDRVNLFKIQTQSLGHIKEMPWDYLSLQTENMNAADIRSAVNYSLFRAVLKNSAHTLETLEYGIDCVKTLTDKRIEKK